MIVCKQCENEFEGNFCPQCGQKATVKRITMRDAFEDLTDKLLPWERGFLYTARKMLTAPGQTVREYLAGKRSRHSKPLSFLTIMVALSLILIPKEELTSAMTAGQTDPRMEKMGELRLSNMTVVFVLMIPFLALFSRWFFRRAGVNYAEHMVFNTLIMGGTSIISLPGYFISKWAGFPLTDPIGYTAQSAFYLTYFLWGYIQFFKPANPWKVGIKSLLVYLFANLIYIVLVGIVGALFVMLFPAAAGAN